MKGTLLTAYDVLYRSGKISKMHNGMRKARGGAGGISVCAATPFSKNKREITVHMHTLVTQYQNNQKSATVTASGTNYFTSEHDSLYCLGTFKISTYV